MKKFIIVLALFSVGVLSINPSLAATNIKGALQFKPESKELRAELQAEHDNGPSDLTTIMTNDKPRVRKKLRIPMNGELIENEEGLAIGLEATQRGRNSLYTMNVDFEATDIEAACIAAARRGGAEINSDVNQITIDRANTSITLPVGIVEIKIRSRQANNNIICNFTISGDFSRDRTLLENAENLNINALLIDQLIDILGNFKFKGIIRILIQNPGDDDTPPPVENPVPNNDDVPNTGGDPNFDFNQNPQATISGFNIFNDPPADTSEETLQAIQDYFNSLDTNGVGLNVETFADNQQATSSDDGNQHLVFFANASSPDKSFVLYLDKEEIADFIAAANEVVKILDTLKNFLNFETIDEDGERSIVAQALALEGLRLEKVTGTDGKISYIISSNGPLTVLPAPGQGDTPVGTVGNFDVTQAGAVNQEIFESNGQI